MGGKRHGEIPWIDFAPASRITDGGFESVRGWELVDECFCFCREEFCTFGGGAREDGAWGS